MYDYLLGSQLTQLNTFFHIFNQNNTAGNVFDGQTRLLGRMMHYGTAFELQDQRNNNGKQN